MVAVEAHISDRLEASAATSTIPWVRERLPTWLVTRRAERYRRIIGETRDSVERNAGYISNFTSAYYRRYLTLDIQDEFYSSYVATIAMISNSNIIVADPEGLGEGEIAHLVGDPEGGEIPALGVDAAQVGHAVEGALVQHLGQDVFRNRDVRVVVEPPVGKTVWGVGYKFELGAAG